MLSNYIEIPIAQLRAAHWNYKKTGEEVAASKLKIREALRKRGQIVNLLVREIPDSDLFEVVNGNHRLEVFQEDGWTHAVCYKLGAIDQATAELIALETNELNVEADPKKLGVLLKHVLEVFPLDDVLKTVPYTVPEITSYVENVLPKENEEGGGGEKKKVEFDATEGGGDREECPRCGYQF